MVVPYGGIVLCFRQLENYVKAEPCMLELIEKLEQLRLLTYGIRIKVLEALIGSPRGVDTADDVKRVVFQLREEK